MENPLEDNIPDEPDILPDDFGYSPIDSQNYEEQFLEYGYDGVKDNILNELGYDEKSYSKDPEWISNNMLQRLMPASLLPVLLAGGYASYQVQKQNPKSWYNSAREKLGSFVGDTGAEKLLYVTTTIRIRNRNRIYS